MMKFAGEFLGVGGCVIEKHLSRYCVSKCVVGRVSRLGNGLARSCEDRAGSPCGPGVIAKGEGLAILPRWQRRRERNRRAG